MKEKGFVLDSSKEQSENNFNLYCDGYYTNVVLEADKSSILLKVGLDNSSYIFLSSLISLRTVKIFNML